MKNVGIFFFLFSLVFLLFLVPQIGADEQAYTLLGEDFNTDEAKLFPYLIGGIILVISIFMIIQGWIKEAKTQTKDSSQIEFNKIIDVGTLLIYCLIYIVLLEPLGFFIVTPVCLVFCLWFFGLRKWLELSMIPILTTAFIYLCFEILMGVHLPKGILEWMFY